MSKDPFGAVPSRSPRLRVRSSDDLRRPRDPHHRASRQRNMVANDPSTTGAPRRAAEPAITRSTWRLWRLRVRDAVPLRAPRLRGRSADALRRSARTPPPRVAAAQHGGQRSIDHRGPTQSRRARNGQEHLAILAASRERCSAFARSAASREVTSRPLPSRPEARICCVGEIARSVLKVLYPRHTLNDLSL
jgi:hypothetical protein